MPQSSASSPLPIAMRSAMIFSTRECSLKFSGIVISTFRQLLQALKRHSGVHRRRSTDVADWNFDQLTANSMLEFGQHRLDRIAPFIHRLPVSRDHRVRLAGCQHALLAPAASHTARACRDAG